MALRASSAGSGRTTRSSSVCQIRSMFSASRRSVRGRRVGRRRRRRVVQQLGDPAELVEDGAAGGLGGVRGEDRAARRGCSTVARECSGSASLACGRRCGQQPALGGAPGAQLAAAVHLLGDVGQVEVGGEGADQLGRRSPGRCRRAARRRPRRRCGSGRGPARRGRGARGPPGGRGSRRAGRRGGGCRAQRGVWRGRGVGMAGPPSPAGGNWDSNPDSRFWRPRA